MKQVSLCYLAAFADLESQKLHWSYLNSPMLASSEHVIESCWLPPFEQAGLPSKIRHRLQFKAKGNETCHGRIWSGYTTAVLRCEEAIHVVSLPRLA